MKISFAHIKTTVGLFAVAGMVAIGAVGLNSGTAQAQTEFQTAKRPCAAICLSPGGSLPRLAPFRIDVFPQRSRA